MKFKDVNFELSISTEVAEHEHLLSFDNDSGAYAFYEWWESVGSEIFNTWLANSREYHDDYTP